MVLSRLLETLHFLYEWQPEEVADLERDLLERMQGIWLQVMRVRAAEHGCNKVPQAARREDLAELRAMAAEDARSIANTWAREVENQLVRLYRDNPRGNRFYYISNMERWAERRGRWKNVQIGNATEQRVAWYATSRFNEMNGVRGQRYRYVGPPPVGQVCIERFAAGVVDEAYRQTNPTPAHPNCPHRWAPTIIEQLPCDDLWVG